MWQKRIDRLIRFAVQGNDPKEYAKAAAKLLLAGFFGVLTGWILQPLFVILGMSYWLAYWPAVLCGFIVNLRFQVKMKNIRIGMGKKKVNFGNATDP